MNTERITTSIEELRQIQAWIGSKEVEKRINRACQVLQDALDELQEPEPFAVGDIVQPGDRSLLPEGTIVVDPRNGSEGFVEASWIYWPGCGATPHAKAVHPIRITALPPTSRFPFAVGTLVKAEKRHLIPAGTVVSGKDGKRLGTIDFEGLTWHGQGYVRHGDAIGTVRIVEHPKP